MSSRWENLTQDVTELAERAEVNRDILIQYERLFQQVTVSSTIKINGLLINTWIASLTGLPSVERILAQARAPHVSGLIALCDLALKYDNVSYTILANTFGVHQVRSVVNLACEIIHNPWCTLSGVPTVVATYADLAFFATEIMYRNTAQGRRRQPNYISPAEKSITKTRVYLVTYADALIMRQATAATHDDPVNIGFKAYGFSVTNSADGAIVIKRQQAQDPNPANGAVVEVTLAAHEIAGYLKSQRNAQDVAFINIMTELKACVGMESIPLLEPTAIAEVNKGLICATKLSSELKQAAELLGATWKADWDKDDSLLTNNMYTNYKVPRDLKYAETHLNDNNIPPLPNNPPPAQNEDNEEQDTRNHHFTHKNI